MITPLGRRHRVAASLYGLVLLLPACADVEGCTPTTTAAADANRVDLTTASQSSTLEARLTVSSDSAPLPGKTLRFAVTDDGAEVYSVDASTGDDGVGRVDLKTVDVTGVQALARGDAFTASFAGDGTYCSSSGEAQFAVVAAPGGVTVTAP